MLILEKKDRERVKGLYQSYNEVVKPAANRSRGAFGQNKPRFAK